MDCYLMRLISFLVVSQNAVLCLKQPTAFLFLRLFSSSALFHYHNGGKTSFA